MQALCNRGYKAFLFFANMKAFEDRGSKDFITDLKKEGEMIQGTNLFCGVPNSVCLFIKKILC